MNNISLFDSFYLGAIQLANRVVMAPMTRTRTSPGDVPNTMMAEYYGQRAGAGLIIAEATDVAPHSKGYLWTPGIYTDAQVDGWKLVTNEVHRNGGKIFLQLWHVGRMSHVSLMPGGQAPWGVTVEQAIGSDVFAHDASGKLTFVRASKPRQIRTNEINGLINDFRQAFRKAAKAGFDGIELHAANGYLFEQFMNAALNSRTDQYGGQSLENRTRFLLEVVDAAIEELGAGKVGIRLSPFGHYNSMPDDVLFEETFFHLCNELNRRGIAYIHLLYQLLPKGNMQEVTKFEEMHLPDEFVATVREIFKGAIIWCGGFTKESAQSALANGNVDLIAFGRPFIGNPDLVARFQNDWPLVVADRSAYYTRNGLVGYTDFPNYRSALAV
ncbi:alkene reductase [Flavihumibacter solisilvae]|uniref:1,2-oxophytodienoate reductase n=1 Tax=Flavihumibacter solisilvae TaxID=1349421 RepID=A0A0C1IHA1_9BACT|nr:alkene reductase [Flavihumibacter solisilvae]KIC93555.1 1,2-oxophytodienoate reductase [Flavihumibacter solisilvae]